MNGIKLGFKIADYAKANNMGIGSFKLKDGSSIKILNDLDRDIVELFHVKEGRLLGAKGFQGEDSFIDAVNLYTKLEKQAININDADKAWSQSLNVEI